MRSLGLLSQQRPLSTSHYLDCSLTSTADPASSSLMNSLACRFTTYIYPVIVGILMFGIQDRDHNFALHIFWTVWWPAIVLIYPFLGRIWCSFCPFMIFGDLTQRWQVSRGVVLKKWPHTSSKVLCLVQSSFFGDLGTSQPARALCN